MIGRLFRATGFFAATPLVTATALAVTPAKAVETARASLTYLTVDVRAECRNGRASFRVWNAGEGWPKAAVFEVYEISGADQWRLAKRRLRMKQAQTVSLRPKLRYRGSEIALRITAPWAKARYNKVRCG